MQGGNAKEQKMNKMKTLQEQLNEWKARRAEAENEMGEALKENDERKYKCALFDYRNADHQVTSVLECIAMNK